VDLRVRLCLDLSIFRQLPAINLMFPCSQGHTDLGEVGALDLLLV